eukprot:146175-Prorocentrum_minimum.AAC.11
MAAVGEREVAVRRQLAAAEALRHQLAIAEAAHKDKVAAPNRWTLSLSLYYCAVPNCTSDGDSGGGAQGQGGCTQPSDSVASSTAIAEAYKDKVAAPNSWILSHSLYYCAVRPATKARLVGATDQPDEATPYVTTYKLGMGIQQGIRSPDLVAPQVTEMERQYNLRAARLESEAREVGTHLLTH